MSVLKKFIPVTVAALALCALPGCSEKSEKSGTPVVKVNGNVITKPEVDRAVQALLANNQVTQKLPPEQMKKAEEAALDQLTAAELLFQEAKGVELKDLDQQIEQKYQKNRSSFPSQAEYEKVLKDIGMTDKEVREQMRKEITVNTFIEQKFAAAATCSDAEAQKFYQDNKTQFFQKGERLKASHILVSVDQKGTPQEKQKAKEKAEALLKRVQGGEDFATVAKKESTCPSRATGGQLGEFAKGQMVPPFEKAAFALKSKGDLSQVVESEFGYHIIKLDDRLPAGTQQFEQVKDKIVQYLKLDKTRKAVAAHVSELRTKAKIEKL